MFFSLTNSPATFQTIMNDIFQDLIADGVVCVYLDDILIFTKMLEEHRPITRIVLDRLREHKLFLRADKCEFEKTEIKYLGVIISHNKVRMDLVKVAGVADWPTPTSRKEVSLFLRFLNFYRRFVEGFSKHAHPLFDLLQQSHQFSWGKVEADTFELMKTLVTLAPVLIMPDDSKPYRVEADSSDFATGGVLEQEGDDGKWHPVAFYSKSLSPFERNYEIHDKELLAIVRLLEEWRHFCEGGKFPVEV